MRSKEVMKGEISILAQNLEEITLWIYFCHKTAVHLVSIGIKITICRLSARTRDGNQSICRKKMGVS
jgi:hypothetical protein